MAKLTKTLAAEWAPRRHQGPYAVAPGYVASSGHDTYDGELSLFAEKLADLPALTVARRHGTEPNFRRYRAGEELLGIVDKHAGF